MITREQLYELIWSTSVLAVGKQFGVSNTVMTRVCRSMNIPRPPLGYPTLVRLGRAPPRPPLPPWQFGTPQVWAKGNAAQQPRPPRIQPKLSQVVGTRGGPKDVHPLIAEARKYLDNASAGNGTQYLFPRKKLMADVITTRECVSKSLNFANVLYSTLQAHAHNVVIAPAFEPLVRVEMSARGREGDEALVHNLPWSPLRPTVAYVFGVPVGLALIEMSEKRHMRYVGSGRFIPISEYRAADHVGPTWDRVIDVPTGRLKFVAYSPFHKIPWQAQWIEEQGAPLDRQVKDIIVKVQLGAITIGDKLEASGWYFA